MKKTLLLLVALITATIAFAQTEIDGIYYNLNDETKIAEVTYQYGWSSDNYYGITSISIPEKVTHNATEYSVTSIGSGAFFGCSSLTSITIPNSVNSIGSEAFNNTPWLNNQPNGCVYINNYLYTYKGEMPENTHIDVKEGTTMICYAAFRFRTSLTSISIPNSVTSIGVEAFYECSSLTSITIPNSVTSIGDHAFRSCSSLTSITIPNNVTYVGTYAFSDTPWLNNQPDGCLYIGKCLYAYKGEMPANTHIDVNEGTTMICGAAFAYYSSLTSITIPNNVTSIGYGAFYYCSSLTSITIPNSVTSIGFEAFYECSSLTSIKCYSSIDHDPFGIEGRTNLTELVCHASWLNIFNEATQASYTNKLTEIAIIEGEVTENGFNFINRSKKTLHTIDLAGATNTTINDLAFYDCYKLENLTLPKNIKTIGYKAFADCKHLTELTIPASVTEISESAFENCRSINSLTFEEGSQLESIGSWAFYNNHALESVNLPEGVTEIGDAAFYGCNYVEEIVIPASVQRIGDNGFALCNQVKRMEVRATTPPTIEAKTFHQVSRSIEFIVPADARNAYAQDEYWREFIQEAPTNVENTIEDVEIYTQNGTLHLEGLTADYQIYNISGQIVYSGNATTIDLAKGIYIIRINDKSQKIVL